MKKIITILVLSIIGFQSGTAQEKSKKTMIKKVTKTEETWKKELSPQQYYILREKGTDRPGDGGFTKHFEKGTYHCAACDLQLFASDSKYDSNCGWPSFDDALEGTVVRKLDKSHGMLRTEILCAACNGHLGHVFNDGPIETTGLRYCVNSTSLKFVKSN